jgi:hypothetical protein
MPAGAIAKLLLPLAAGAAALVAFGKDSKAATPAPKPGAGGVAPIPNVTTTTTTTATSPGIVPSVAPGAPVPSAATIAAITAAMASADPDKMRAVANDLEAQGFRDQANTLRAAADAVQAAMRAAPTVQTGQAGIPTVPIPGAAQGAPLPLPAVQTVDPQRALAAALNLEVAASAKGSENKALVLQYQRQENARGKAVGKEDGLYGPKTALTLATDWGLVPTKPLYWPVNPTPAQQAYKKALLAVAALDPQRAEEWARAAKV